MSNLNVSNNNGSMPTAQVAVDSNTKVMLYRVPITADIQASLDGDAKVYAISKGEAIAKVREQINGETLDGEVEMEDAYSGFTTSYADVIGSFHFVEIDESGVEVIEDDVDPADVLEEEVKQLQANISWNAQALAKHKTFLQSLLNEDGDLEAVAAA